MWKRLKVIRYRICFVKCITFAPLCTNRHFLHLHCARPFFFSLLLHKLSKKNSNNNSTNDVFTWIKLFSDNPCEKEISDWLHRHYTIPFFWNFVCKSINYIAINRTINFELTSSIVVMSYIYIIAFVFVWQELNNLTILVSQSNPKYAADRKVIFFFVGQLHPLHLFRFGRSLHAIVHLSIAVTTIVTVFFPPTCSSHIVCVLAANAMHY